MRRHIKHEAESDLGPGVVYIEFTDDEPTRQVEVYGDVWLWGDSKHLEYLADRCYGELGLSEEHDIPQAEFERVWEEALRRCPRSS